MNKQLIYDEVLLEHLDIDRINIRLMEEITDWYPDDSNLICICILEGAVTFFTDLTREFGYHEFFPYIKYIKVSSYDLGFESSGNVQIKSNMINIPIQGKEILIIDDICDTGQTMKTLIEYFKTRGAKSVKGCVLLGKETMYENINKEDIFIGKIIDNDKFVVGYGLDFQDRYRNLPYIIALDKNKLVEKNDV